jgi:hypothetical protein
VTYQLLFKPPYMEGHKVHREDGTGRIAISDWSGSTPDKTEDGPLFLDTNPERRAFVNMGGGRLPWVNIPLLDRNGGATSTITTLRSAIAMRSAAPDLRFEFDHEVRTLLAQLTTLSRTFGG